MRHTGTAVSEADLDGFLQPTTESAIVPIGRRIAGCRIAWAGGTKAYRFITITEKLHAEAVSFIGIVYLYALLGS